MNVFVLNTGRCGSVTFAEACRHITNYTTAHESRTGKLGNERLAFPPRHIEVDNRLSWILGRVDATYGDEAFYVHLIRSPEAVAASFAKRYGRGVIKAYAQGLLWRLPKHHDPQRVCEDYVQTVTSNIRWFLKDKSQTMRIDIEQAKQDFPVFWRRIGAEGSLEAALAEFDVRHNDAESAELGIIDQAKQLFRL